MEKVKLTITAHADGDALLETTVLAAIPVDPEDAALLVLGARPILYLLLDAPSEEALRRRITKALVSLAVAIRRRSRGTIVPGSRAAGQVAFAQAPHQFDRIDLRTERYTQTQFSRATLKRITQTDRTR